MREPPRPDDPGAADLDATPLVVARREPPADLDATPLVVARREPPAEELAPGSALGDYVIEARRGAGGFATVYRARRGATGERVALKVLHAHLMRAPSIVRRFGREAELIARLAHPGIVRLLDHGLRDGRSFLVMEWIEGPTLAELLRARGPLALDEVLPIVAALADALDTAHALGVVHRDLKAANVVVAARGVTLLDFGIAKLLEATDRAAGITTAGSKLGTPHYMAPEQIAGGAIDHRVDVYALGVLVFELLTGRRPFEGDDPIEVEERQLREVPPRASALAAVAPGIDAAIRRAMAKAPALRPGSAGALVAELRAASEPAVPAAVRATRSPAVALHVQVEVRREDTEDAVLDRVDRMLAQLRDGAVAAGLAPAGHAGRAWLFVGAPRDGAMPALIERVDQLARDALVAIAHPDVALALTIHVVELDGEPACAQDLLTELAPAAGDASAVRVTRAAQSWRA